MPLHLYGIVHEAFQRRPPRGGTRLKWDQVLIRSSAMVMEVRAAAEGGVASTGGDSTPYGTESSGFGGWVGAISAVAEQAVVVVVDKVGMAKVDVGLVMEGEG